MIVESTGFMVTLILWSPELNIFLFTGTNYLQYYYFFPGPLSEIVSGKVQDEVATFKSELFKVRNGLAQQPSHQDISKDVLANISDLKDPLRLLDVVCNKSLCERHWKKVSES